MEDVPPQRARYVAIITDGNGRWAQARGLPVADGHQAGADVVKARLRDAAELGVEELTVYSFSTENWSRRAEEVTALMRMFSERHRSRDARAEGARACGCGSSAARARRRGAAGADGLGGGRDRRQRPHHAVRRVQLRRPRRDPATPPSATTGGGEEAFRQALYAPEMHDPDLVIRTSGEQRLCNYLLWQSAYSELVFADELWPDFSREAFEAALADLRGPRPPLRGPLRWPPPPGARRARGTGGSDLGGGSSSRCPRSPSPRSSSRGAGSSSPSGYPARPGLPARAVRDVRLRRAVAPGGLRRADRPAAAAHYGDQFTSCSRSCDAAAGLRPDPAPAARRDAGDQRDDARRQWIGLGAGPRRAAARPSARRRRRRRRAARHLRRGHRRLPRRAGVRPPAARAVDLAEQDRRGAADRHGLRRGGRVVGGAQPGRGSAARTARCSASPSRSPRRSATSSSPTSSATPGPRTPGGCSGPTAVRSTAWTRSCSRPWSATTSGTRWTRRRSQAARALRRGGRPRRRRRPATAHGDRDRLRAPGAAAVLAAAAAAAAAVGGGGGRRGDGRRGRARGRSPVPPPSPDPEASPAPGSATWPSEPSPWSVPSPEDPVDGRSPPCWVDGRSPPSAGLRWSFAPPSPRSDSPVRCSSVPSPGPGCAPRDGPEAIPWPSPCSPEP